MTIWEIVISVFGLIYAILMGLLLVEAHRNWGDLSLTVRREIKAIAEIIDLLRIFNKDLDNEAVTKKVRKTLSKYLQNELLYIRWNDSGEQKISIVERKNVDAIMKAVDELKPKRVNEYNILNKITDRVLEIGSCRIDRLDFVRQGIHKTYYWIVIFITLAIVLGLCMLDVKDYWQHLSIIIVTSVILYTMFTILVDIDHPVQGHWDIQKETNNTIELILPIEWWDRMDL